MKVNFIGNKKVTDLIYNMIANNKLSHSYLFYGAKGLGKTTLAKAFAQAILCQNKKNGQACGECLSCKKAFADNHPDIVFVTEPDKKKKGISIDTVRQMRADAIVKPNESDYKIIVLENIENMSIGAINALLKIVEQPPSHVIFILTCENSYAIAETIRSRCICLELNAVTDSECLLALCDNDADADLKNQAVMLANGNIGRAVECLENPQLAIFKQDASDFMTYLGARSGIGLLEILAKYEKDKPLAISFLGNLIATASELLRCKACGGSDDPQIAKLALNISSSKLLAVIEACQNAINNINSNANVSLVLTYIVTQIK